MPPSCTAAGPARPCTHLKRHFLPEQCTDAPPLAAVSAVAHNAARLAHERACLGVAPRCKQPAEAAWQPSGAVQAGLLLSQECNRTYSWDMHSTPETDGQCRAGGRFRGSRSWGAGCKGSTAGRNGSRDRPHTPRLLDVTLRVFSKQAAAAAANAAAVALVRAACGGCLDAVRVGRVTRGSGIPLREQRRALIISACSRTVQPWRW